MAILEVRGLQKKYGKTLALRGVDLDVEEGEIFGFLGANGAGKTTFTKCVTGFIRPTSGTVHIAGVNAVRNPAKSLAHLGIVPDEYELYEHLTAKENLEFYASLYGLKGKARDDRVAEVLQIVGMADKANKKAKAFSHGMKQRTCIAQAILHNPKIVILDEPTNGLDPRGAFELRELMKKLALQGTAIFLNSHVMSEVEQVCDRIAIVRDGNIIALGSPQELTQQAGGHLATRIRILNPSPKILAGAQAVAPVTSLGTHQIEVRGDPATVGRVVTAIARAGGLVHEVESVGSSLEETFLKMTGGP